MLMVGQGAMNVAPGKAFGSIDLKKCVRYSQEISEDKGCAHVLPTSGPHVGEYVGSGQYYACGSGERRMDGNKGCRWDGSG